MAALEIVGRDEELAVVAGFLADTNSLPRVLLIEGEAGIGKTTVWPGTNCSSPATPVVPTAPTTQAIPATRGTRSI